MPRYMRPVRGEVGSSDVSLQAGTGCAAARRACSSSSEAAHRPVKLLTAAPERRLAAAVQISAGRKEDAALRHKTTN